MSAIVLGGSQAVVAAPLETLDVYAGLREVLVAYNAAYGARARCSMEGWREGSIIHSHACCTHLCVRACMRLPAEGLRRLRL